MTARKKYMPEMHTAEHILNQTMVRQFDCGRSFSAHIERKKSKCDYHMDEAPSAEDIRKVEDRVNEVIRADMPVTETFLPRQQAREEFDLKRLPDDVDEQIRIVRVGDYDACPCIGPHVASTREIGSFRITSSDFKDGIFRIRYKLSRPVPDGSA